MENFQIAAVFDETADILELIGENPFKVRSYRTAARTVRDLPSRVEDMAEEEGAIERIPGVGGHIAAQIREILADGISERLRELRGTLPAGLNDLMKVPGLGPKKVRLIYDALGVTTLDQLRKAAEEHRIEGLPRMGRTTETNILKGLDTISQGRGRILMKEAADQVRSLGRALDRCRTIDAWTAAGSFRRRAETVGDIDILIRSRDREEAAAEALDNPEVATVVARGREKVTARLRSGIQVDFRFFEPKSFGAAVLYFTGSKAHNIALRRIAQKRGWKLNEYGLFDGERMLAGAREDDVYLKLGLEPIPPELREDRGEVQAAAAGELPKLVRLSDIKGDLHSHTSETDGRSSLGEMVESARAKGYEYLAVTDHSKALAMTGGLDEKRLRAHARRIREAGQELDGFRLLAGVEVDILKDGRLDLDEDALAELDWVNASVHSHFAMDRRSMTRRILAAVRSGVVNCISHPLGRRIGERDPVEFDMDEVFGACAERGVCVEINAYPDRLDLPDIHCRRARDLGVTFVISTDAHKITDLDFMEYGVSVARRGWLTREDVLNTLPAAVLLERVGKQEVG